MHDSALGRARPRIPWELAGAVGLLAWFLVCSARAEEEQSPQGDAEVRASDHRASEAAKSDASAASQSARPINRPKASQIAPAKEKESLDDAAKAAPEAASNESKPDPEAMAPPPSTESPSEPTPWDAGEKVLARVRPTPSRGESEPSPAVKEQRTILEPTVFKGIEPGRGTRAEVDETWGPADEIAKQGPQQELTFRMAPFDRVIVSIENEIVISIVIYLKEPLSAEELEKQLRIGESEPVLVADSQGALLGQAYPERGVLFSFAGDPADPLTGQIVLEPIDPQPFVLRAKTKRTAEYQASLADLDQAIELAPNLAEAYALRADVLLRVGAIETAIKAAERAVELAPKLHEYRLLLARTLAEASDYLSAVQQVRSVIDAKEVPPIVLARAYCQWGDCLAAAATRDYAQAVEHHLRAIRLAEPLAEQEPASLRRQAKEILLHAHLALARDVGWGNWRQKTKTVSQWLTRAAELADDLIKNEEADDDLRLRVYEETLAAVAGIAEPPDASTWVHDALDLARRLIDEADDESRRNALQWRMGLALYDALQIAQARRQYDDALEYGQMAADYMEQGDAAGKERPGHDYLLGRLLFRIGSIHALARKDHREAVRWHDKAVRLLESPVPNSAQTDPGRQGETFVSMAVSYWETGARNEAIRLTEEGAKLMEHATEAKILDKTALAVPYGNLANMHSTLGNDQLARKFAELAVRHERKKARGK